jgi:AraC-like DNA-binding protein
MAVVFEFKVGEDFHFSSAFARRFNTKLEQERIWLPDVLGEGFIQEVPLGNGMSLCMHSYVLKQTLVLRRQVSDKDAAADFLSIKFDSRRMSVSAEADEEAPLLRSNNGYEIELSTANLFTELAIPPGQQINFLVVTISRRQLLQLLQPGEKEQAVAAVLKDSRSFLLHEGMTSQIERKLKQLSQLKVNTPLLPLLYQTKAQELIYLFFIKLLARDINVVMPINQTDADRIYEVRALILRQLDTPPQLPVLAREIGMSQTKMKTLFRQVFGDSIYNYYQSARMDEAAQLLNSMTVSEAGYRLGFANLSHFARLFEKHFHIKPKKYQEALRQQQPVLDDE